ncbi:MAG: hypothetical protein LBR88_10370 [Zoogloeaceae bacterium]|jgi:hypothetical protein|nr:hypothetical protein [Zoogloeaceae bacterium]
MKKPFWIFLMLAGSLSCFPNFVLGAKIGVSGLEDAARQDMEEIREVENARNVKIEKGVREFLKSGGGFLQTCEVCCDSGALGCKVPKIKVETPYTDYDEANRHVKRQYEKCGKSVYVFCSSL